MGEGEVVEGVRWSDGVVSKAADGVFDSGCALGRLRGRDRKNPVAVGGAGRLIRVWRILVRARPRGLRACAAFTAATLLYPVETGAVVWVGDGAR